MINEEEFEAILSISSLIHLRYDVQVLAGTHLRQNKVRQLFVY
jgi:hypothetical protein